MTQEDKELLLKDLCARLPYHPKCECDWKKTAPNGTVGYIDELSTFLIEQFEFADELDDIPIKSVKPYLRPISSMTEEEKEELNNVLEFQYYSDDSCMCESTDWLNAHHFDYRGLIGKGLAIEVTEENNPYERVN